MPCVALIPEFCDQIKQLNDLIPYVWLVCVDEKIECSKQAKEQFNNN
jgi:hypothetical protein